MGLVCIQNSSLLVYSKSQKVSASYCLPFRHSRGKNQPVGGFRPPPPACLGLRNTLWVSHRLATKVNLWYQDADPFMLIDHIVSTDTELNVTLCSHSITAPNTSLLLIYKNSNFGLRLASNGATPLLAERGCQTKNYFIEACIWRENILNGV